MQNQKLGANYADEEELDDKINELLVFFKLKKKFKGKDSNKSTRKKVDDIDTVESFFK